jgi:hypothetical protein
MAAEGDACSNKRRFYLYLWMMFLWLGVVYSSTSPSCPAAFPTVNHGEESNLLLVMSVQPVQGRHLFGGVPTNENESVMGIPSLVFPWTQLHPPHLYLVFVCSPNFMQLRQANLRSRRAPFTCRNCEPNSNSRFHLWHNMGDVTPDTTSQRGAEPGLLTEPTTVTPTFNLRPKNFATWTQLFQPNLYLVF